jgi:2-amino-4-hydroxy-6-hydroxymethyldihydropteridine diphosphokinase
MEPRGERRTLVAYIGLGANLGDPVNQILAARRELQLQPGLCEVAFSGLYRSAPMGPENQPDYVNAVMAVSTRIGPHDLLALLQRVENVHGRVRTGEHWGPRTLDLDLLLYGDETIARPELTVPHPGIADREFVLIPLFEIAPELSVPGCGTLRELMRTCSRRESPLTRIEYAHD